VLILQHLSSFITAVVFINSYYVIISELKTSVSLECCDFLRYLESEEYL